jgi:uncharacterized membrane protein YfcA
MVWLGSIPGAVIGVVLILTFLQSSLSSLSFVLAFVLLLTSASMFISFDFRMQANTARAVSAFAGGFIGLSVATTSVGAGALGMAIFRALLGGKEAKNLVGTDIVHAIPIALIAGAAYFSAGLVDLQLLNLLILGSVPGAFIGSKLTANMESASLKRYLSLVLALAALGIVINLI